MGRLRGWLRRLERASEEELISISQKDGSIKRFAPSALGEAFLVSANYLRGGDAQRHPLNIAAQNAADAQWRDTFYNLPRLSEPGCDVLEDVEDLSVA